MSGHLRRLMKVVALVAGFVVVANPSALASAKVPETQPGRVVVIGDAHGDIDQYLAILMEAEVVNERGLWTGGETILVQLGDVVDRGAKSRKILDLLKSLQKQAPRSGGSVQFVIGNHEAMNIKGDLRYVSAGEYESYETWNSGQQRDAYFERYKSYLRENREGGKIMNFDEAYRAEWNETHPLGWVEHRQAWAPDGLYGKWTIEQKGVIKLGNLLFVHGGISPKYARSSIKEINDLVSKDLKAGQDVPATITNEADGPMWYRGMAQHSQEQEAANVDMVLQHYGVDHVIMGHTPLAEVIIPRFNGKVIVADVGLSEYYGSAFAFVEVVDGTLYANQRGQRLALPMDGGAALKAYLEKARSLEESHTRLDAYMDALYPAQ
ncbi:MAG: protein-tyrosine-phosphatase [Alphaproteobacteria bacterium]|nr:MAG: protein-tyrosine-phosphatase [Alphaproteobacteria bacterium]